MKSVIILKSRGNQLFFAMLDAKMSSISSCVPVHLLQYEDYSTWTPKGMSVNTLKGP
jgi:hypothetical protein